MDDFDVELFAKYLLEDDYEGNAGSFDFTSNNSNVLDATKNNNNNNDDDDGFDFLADMMGENEESSTPLVHPPASFQTAQSSFPLPLVSPPHDSSGYSSSLQPPTISSSQPQQPSQPRNVDAPSLYVQQQQQHPMMMMNMLAAAGTSNPTTTMNGFSALPPATMAAFQQFTTALQKPMAQNSSFSQPKSHQSTMASADNNNNLQIQGAFPLIPHMMFANNNNNITSASCSLAGQNTNTVVRTAPMAASGVIRHQSPAVSEYNSTEDEASTTPKGRPKKRKTVAQKARRRERNRVFAKKIRDKKKDYLEDLQKEVMELQRENQKLKGLVRSELNGAAGILESCDAVQKIPPSVLEACQEMEKADPEQKFDMVTRMKTSQHCFIITDPSLADNPIVFASGDFLKLTGYDRSQILGRNCRMLQGPATCRAKVQQIRESLVKDEDVSVTLINYRADGTPFWNKIFIAALRNGQNNVVNYMGVSVEVAGPEPGDPEHGKALPVGPEVESSSQQPPSNPTCQATAIG